MAGLRHQLRLLRESAPNAAALLARGAPAWSAEIDAVFLSAYGARVGDRSGGAAEKPTSRPPPGNAAALRLLTSELRAIDGRAARLGNRLEQIVEGAEPRAEPQNA